MVVVNLLSSSHYKRDISRPQPYTTPQYLYMATIMKRLKEKLLDLAKPNDKHKA